MTTFRVVYNINAANTDAAKETARRKLLEETNAVVQYRQMGTTECYEHENGEFTVGIEFEPHEQVVEHSPEWWMSNFNIRKGSIANEPLSTHHLF